jgi:hypothetical protein
MECKIHGWIEVKQKSQLLTKEHIYSIDAPILVGNALPLSVV